MRLYVVLTKIGDLACAYVVRAKNVDDAVARLKKKGDLLTSEKVLDVAPAVSVVNPNEYTLRALARVL